MMNPFSLKTVLTLVEADKWARFWARLTGRARLDEGDTARPSDGRMTEAGAHVDSESALRLSAFWACVSLRADTISSLPLHVKKADRTLATNHPLYDRLHTSPNYDQTASEFLAVMVASLDIWGNGYARIDTNRDGEITALTPFDPSRMSVKRLESGALQYRYERRGKDPLIYTEDRVLHFRGFTLDGIMGLSPLEYMAETLGDALIANRAHSQEFKNGLKVGGFLKVPPTIDLSDTQREKFRQNLERFGRPENAGKWMLAEHGIEPVGANAIRMNPQVAQLLEGRYFGIEEIARCYRVPPPLIGHTDKASSWASSLAGLNQGFLTYCIRPTLVRMEQTMAKKLQTPEDRKRAFIRFNFRGLLRGSFSEQTTSYGSALDKGWMNIDEVRELEDLPDLPDDQGKVYRVPMNTEPVAANAGAPAPGTPPPPAPGAPPALPPAPAAPQPAPPPQNPR